MNKNATVNNDTKYTSIDDFELTFALHSGNNAANVGGDEAWFTTLFGIAGAFVGPSGTVPPRLYTGDLYVLVGYTSKTYIQLALLGYSNIVEITSTGE